MNDELRNNALMSKVIGVKCICNTASINIYGYSHGVNDYVEAGINDATPRKYKLRYNSSGDVYFMFHGIRHYLYDFIKV